MQRELERFVKQSTKWTNRFDNRKKRMILESSVDDDTLSTSGTMFAPIYIYLSISETLKLEPQENWISKRTTRLSRIETEYKLRKRWWQLIGLTEKIKYILTRGSFRQCGSSFAAPSINARRFIVHYLDCAYNNKTII